MQNKFIKKQFFKKDEKFKNKSFLINANDNIFLNEDDNKSIYTGIYFKLYLEKIEQNLKIKILLYAWCNNKQKYVPLKVSIWREKEFGDSKYIPKIEFYYEKIIENFLNIFEQLKYHWQLKEIIYRLENPTFVFHYKLINTFSQDILERIMLRNFKNYPKLNINLLKNTINSFEINYIILPTYVNGFFMGKPDKYEIEISIDLDKSDFAIIEDFNKGIITKDEFLEIIKYKEG